MSLGPVKPVIPSLATQMSQAWIEPANGDEDDKPDQENKNKSGNNHQNTQGKTGHDKKSDRAKKGTSKDVHRILKKAAEAEAPKVNILGCDGKKRVPDVSGMVINILT